MLKVFDKVPTVDSGFNRLLDRLLEDLTLPPYFDNSAQLLLHLIRCPSVSGRSGFGNDLVSKISKSSSHLESGPTYGRESYEKVILASSLRLLSDF